MLCCFIGFHCTCCGKCQYRILIFRLMYCVLAMKNLYPICSIFVKSKAFSSCKWCSEDMVIIFPFVGGSEPEFPGIL
jgi:hypothetical protein